MPKDLMDACFGSIAAMDMVGNGTDTLVSSVAGPLGEQLTQGAAVVGRVTEDVLGTHVWGPGGDLLSTAHVDATGTATISDGMGMNTAQVAETTTGFDISNSGGELMMSAHVDAGDSLQFADPFGNSVGVMDTTSFGAPEPFDPSAGQFSDAGFDSGGFEPNIGIGEAGFAGPELPGADFGGGFEAPAADFGGGFEAPAADFGGAGFDTGGAGFDVGGADLGGAGFEMPEMEIPDFDIPDLDIPDVDIPDFDF